MTINPADVAQAYNNVAKSAGSLSGSGPLDQSERPSFGDFLKDQIEGVVDTGKISETTAIKSLSGEAELVDVVTAISAAEVTLETVVAVRDKVLGAYNEILRMPI